MREPVVIQLEFASVDNPFKMPCYSEDLFMGELWNQSINSRHFNNEAELGSTAYSSYQPCQKLFNTNTFEQCFLKKCSSGWCPWPILGVALREAGLVAVKQFPLSHWMP